MPNPNRGESKNKFISRAIPTLRKEGYPQLQAVAIAHSKWERRNKKK